MNEVVSLIESQGQAFEAWRRKQDARFAELAQAHDDLETKLSRQALLGGGIGYSGNPASDKKSLDLAFRALMKGNQEAASRHFSEVKGMMVADDSAGGYLVLPSFADAINRVMLDAAPFLGLPRVVEITGDSYVEPVDHSSLEASWVSETGSRPETSTPTLGLATIALHELYAMPKLSQKLIDTAAYDVVAWLTSKVGEQFGKSEESAFLSGNGVGRPKGILTYPTEATADSTRAWGTIEHVMSGATATITADALVQIRRKMKSQYLANACWVMNRETASQIERLKDGSGQYLWQTGLTAGAPDTLLGFRVILSEYMPDVAAGTYPIMLINGQAAYTKIRNKGIKVLADPYSEKGHVLLYTTERVGGQMTNFEAAKLLKIGT